MATIKIVNIPLSTDKYPIKATHSMKPMGITIHETDNNASARNEIAYMQRNNNKVSYHFAVDEKEIIQGLPLNRNGWHSSDGNGPGNRKTIAIEICRNYARPSGAIPAEYKAARANAEKLTGYLMHKYGWTDKDIYTHNGWSGKNCPRRILEQGYLNTFKKNAMSWKRKFDGATVVEKPSAKPSTPAAGKAQIKKGAKFRSLATRYDGLAVPSSLIGKDMDYKLNLVKGKDWVYFPSIQSYVSKSDTNLGGTTSKPKPTPKPTPKPKPVAPTGKTKIKKGAKYRSLSPKYDGLPVPNSVAGKPLDYKLNQIKGKDWVYFPSISSYVAFKDTELSNQSTSSKIKVGDRVVVRSGARSYDGVRVTTAWYTTPKVVSEISGNRAVLDSKSWNTPFKVSDLIKV